MKILKKILKKNGNIFFENIFINMTKHFIYIYIICICIILYVYVYVYVYEI